MLGSDSRGARKGWAVNAWLLPTSRQAWLPSDGPRLWRALIGASGKRDKRTMIAVGTRAPAGPGHWWPQLLEQPLPAKWARIDLSAPDPGRWLDVLKVNRYAAAHPSGAMHEVLKSRVSPGTRSPSGAPAIHR